MNLVYGIGIKKIFPFGFQFFKVFVPNLQICLAFCAGENIYLGRYIYACLQSFKKIIKAKAVYQVKDSDIEQQQYGT
jgi:hypothetical protein